MLKDLIKEGGLYTIANLVTKGVSLLLIPFYTDYFTEAEYGIITMLGIAGAISAAFFSFQIYQGVGRFISPKETSVVDQKKIGSTGFWFTVISYIAFLIIAYLFREPIINLLSEDEQIQEKTYLWSLVAIALNGVVNALSVQLKFLRRTKVFSLSTFLFAFLNIIFILIFALGLNYRVDSIYMASIIAGPLIIIMQVYFLKDQLIFYIGKLELRKLLKFSSPLIPAALAYLVLNLTDKIFIKEIEQSLAQVGIYDLAFKFSSIVSIIVLSFQSALAPLVFENHSESETKVQLSNIFKLFIGIGTIGGLCLSFFSFETLYVFTNEKYYAASVVMPLFYVTVLIQGLGMFSPGIQIKNKTKLFPIIVGISGIINVGLNLYLIPRYGLLGAAWATFISTVFNNLVLFIISQRLYHIPLNNVKNFTVLSVFTITFLFGTYFINFLNLDFILSLLVRILVIGIYFYFIVQMNFINLDAVKRNLFGKKIN